MQSSQPMTDQTPSIARIDLLITGASAVAGGVLILTFALNGLWLWAALSLGVTAVGVLLERLPAPDRLCGLVFVGFVMLSTASLLQGHVPLAGLVATAAALVVWDLHAFRQRLASVGHIEAAPRLMRAHVQRLFTVVGLGLVLGTAALLVRMSLDIGLIVLLGLLLIVGLSQTISFLRKKSD